MLRKYLQAAGYHFIAVALLSVVSAYGCMIFAGIPMSLMNCAEKTSFSDRWLAEWADEEDNSTDIDRHKYAYVYIAANVGFSVFALAGSLFFICGGMRAGQNM